LFLRTPGASLDNNTCERELKRTILHRANALLFKTTNGIGDLLMSLIYTSELRGVNPLKYLTELEQQADTFARPQAAGCPGTIGRCWRASTVIRYYRPTFGQPPLTTAATTPSELMSTCRRTRFTVR